MRAIQIAASLILVRAVLAQAPLYDLSGQTGDEFGHSVATIGDVDGDGFDDFAVGAPFGNGLQVDAGYVNIYSASNGYPIRTLSGERTGDRFGWSVAGLGDINGDGVGDLVVGAPYHEWTTGTDRGAAYMISGATGLQLWKLGGNADNDWLGWSVAGIGDATGDGVPDYALGQPNYDLGMTDVGRVVVMSGATHAFVRSFIGESAGSLFGFAVSSAGDVDGDSRGDLIIGAPYYGGVNAYGRAYVARMTAAPTGWSFLAQGSSGGHLGHAVAGGADFNGDSVLDYVVGEPYRKQGTQLAGRAIVISGVNNLWLHTFNGTGDDWAGYSVAVLRDFDGDGRGDLAVGSPYADTAGVDHGAANVYSGATWSLLSEAVGYFPNERMGSAVASAGLLNNDPWTDALFGCPWSSIHGAFCGRARLVLGNAPYPIGYCTAKTNSAGCTPFISFTGCPSVSISNYFNLEAREVLPNFSGILIWSLSPSATPFHGGTLCLGSPIRRTPMQVSTTIAGVNCNGGYNFFINHAQLASWGLTAGDDFYAQYWSRDPGFPAPDNIGLTNGLKVTVLP